MDVVGADEDDDDLRIGTIEGAVFDAPQEMLGAVTRNAEIAHSDVTEEVLENSGCGGSHSPAGTTPRLGDGIAEKQQIPVSLRCDLHSIEVLIHPWSAIVPASGGGPVFQTGFRHDRPWWWVVTGKKGQEHRQQ